MSQKETKKAATNKDTKTQSTSPEEEQEISFPSNDRYHLGHSIALRIENHLWDSLVEWSDIYQQVQGRAMTPPLVAKRFIHETVRRLNLMRKKGELDLDDPDCYLP